jgi:hypothetical protein
MRDKRKGKNEREKNDSLGGNWSGFLRLCFTNWVSGALIFGSLLGPFSAFSPDYILGLTGLLPTATGVFGYTSTGQ